ncbi:hypothetical protein [Eubacterium maltosivorans]|uniref:hypothetical protein n=1 Tax=Eubacterium maltosivorans TaxID=2041044 RepID=UPI00189DF800|nr:hypothetical protein [Eubacterium maltosivorans]
MWLTSAPPEPVLNFHQWIVIIVALGGLISLIFGLWRYAKGGAQNWKKKNIQEADERLRERLSEIKKRQNDLEKEQQTLNGCIMAMMHDRIYQGCSHFIERGYVSIDDVKNMEHLYEPYQKNGGNGTARKLYTAFMKLPTEEEYFRELERKND